MAQFTVEYTALFRVEAKNAEDAKKKFEDADSVEANADSYEILSIRED